MRYSHLFLDIDGIVDWEPTDEYLGRYCRAFERLLARRISVSFLTARPFPLVRPMIAAFGLDSQLHVTDCGASIHDEGALMRALTIESSFVTELLALVKTLPKSRFVQVATPQQLFLTDECKERLKLSDDLLGLAELCKWSTDKEATVVVIRGLLEDDVRLLSAFTVSKKAALYAEKRARGTFTVAIRAPTAGKAEALRYLDRQGRIVLAQCVFIGHSEDDVEALDIAGFSIVPRDAVVQAKSVASLELDSQGIALIEEAISVIWQE